MRLRSLRLIGCAVGAVSLLLSGCSSDSDSSSRQTIEPATAAQSPAVTTAPAGRVQPVGVPVEALAYDATTDTVAAVAEGGAALLILDARSPETPPRRIAVDGAADTVVIGKPGEALVPNESGVARVDLATGNVTEVETTAPARSARLLPDQGLAVGLSNGTIDIVGTDGTSSSTVSGLVSVDALAVTGDSLTALDRRQTSLTEVDVADSSLGLSLRAGQGAATLTPDHFGRMFVTDPAANALLVYTADSLVLRQQGPVGPGPYAVAYDDRAELAWVTVTGSNEVVAYDVSEGIPKQVRRLPTVRQPNSVTVNPATGELFVGSATDEGVQRIPTADGGR